MCLAVPVQVETLKPETQSATVTVSGVKVEVSTKLYKKLEIGDYVLVHAGFIIDKIKPEDVAETLKTFEDYQKTFEE
jgi:hydrogenase expression/formation protein HypC